MAFRVDGSPPKPPVQPRLPQQAHASSSVSSVAIQAINNQPVKDESSFFGKVFNKVAAGFIDFVIPNTHHRDSQILLSILGDQRQVEQFIHRIAPQIMQMLPQLIPDTKQFFSDASETNQELIDRILFHIMANLALAAVPSQSRHLALEGMPDENSKKTPEQLARQITIHLVEKIGSGINAVDAQVMNQKNKIALEPKLFTSLATHLVDLVLPPQDPYWGLLFPSKKTVVDKASETWVMVYEKLDKALSGKAAADAPSINLDPLEGLLQECGLFLSHALSNTSLKRDRETLKLLTGSDDFYALTQKLAPGLGAQLVGFLPKQIEKFFGNSLQGEATEALLMHAFSSLAKDFFADELKDKKEVSVELVIKRIAEHITTLFETEFETCDDIRKQGGVVNSASFGSLSAKLVKLLLPKKSFISSDQPHFLQEFLERRKNTLLAPISEIFLKIYENQSDEKAIQDYKNRLRKVFSDDKSAVVKADMEKLVDHYYVLCQKAVAVGGGKVLSEFFQDKDWVADQLQKLGGEQAPQLSQATLERLNNGISNIFHPKSAWVGEQLQKAGELMLFKSLVHWLEKVPPEDRFPTEKLLGNALQVLLKSANVNLSDILEKLQERLGDIDQALDAEEIASERLKVAEELVKPFIDDLIHIFFEDDARGETFEQLLPLPEAGQKMIVRLAREKALGFFANTLLASTSWISQRQDNSARLQQLFNSDEPSKLCNTVGELAEHAIPWVLRENKQTIVDGAMTVLTPQIGQAPMPLMQQMVAGLVEYAGSNQADPVQHALRFIGYFTETALLKLAGDSAQGLQRMEAETAPGEPSLMQKAAMGLTVDLLEHFSPIVQAKKDSKAKSARLNRELLIDNFKKFKDKELNEVRDVLHPAVDNEQKQIEFFIKWAKDIFKIFGIKEDKLPFPELAQSKVFKALEQGLLPMLLAKLFNEVNNPHKLNGLLLKLFQHIEISMPKSEQPHKMIWNLIQNKPLPEEHRREFDDPYQKELEIKLGYLAKALVELQPSGLPRLAMRIKKTREITGEAIGQALRGAIMEDQDNPRPILEILGLGMEKVNAAIKSNDWAELFPRTPEEKAVGEQKAAKARREAEDNLPKALRKVLSKQTDKLMENIAIRTLTSIEKFFKNLINAVFGRSAERVAKIIMPLVRYLVELPVYLFLKLLHLIFWLPIKGILSFYIKSESESRLKDIQLNIHDNLFYHVFGDIVELVVKGVAEEPDAPQPA